MTLEPIDPETAVESYLNSRKGDLSDLSLQNHRYRLERFLEWCNEENVHDMNSITGRRIHEFTNWRSEQVKRITLKTTLDTLRVFLRFCEDIEAVVPGTSEKVPRPSLNLGEDADDTILTEWDANQILDHMEKWSYASLDHAAVFTLWHTGMRVGTAHALDLEDYNSLENYVEICHRPETGTPLKNKRHAEREVHLMDELCEVLDDYIEQKRPDVEDEHGRKPLFATSRGRASTSTFRRIAYKATRPCQYSGPCPHDREISECEAVIDRDKFSKCPSTVSPHAFRRGAITYHLKKDIPIKVISDRMDVSKEVLERHYDGRKPNEKRRQRKSFLDNI